MMKKQSLRKKKLKNLRQLLGNDSIKFYAFVIKGIFVIFDK